MSDAAATMAVMEHFNQTLVYARSGTPAEVRSDLEILAQFDAEAERQSKYWGRRAGVGCGTMVLGIIAAFTAFNMEFIPVGIGAIAVIVIALAAAIYCGINYGKWSARDIENRRYQLLTKLVDHLSCDMARDSTLEVRLDGNSYHKPEYLHAPDGGVISTDSAAYRLPWLTLSGELLDGHRFSIQATQFVKRKEKRKRKYTKVKEALTERVDIEVRCKTQKYARFNELPQILRRLNPRLPLSAWNLNVNGGRVTLSGLTPRGVAISGRRKSGAVEPGYAKPEAVLGLLALLYRGLELVRK